LPFDVGGHATPALSSPRREHDPGFEDIAIAIVAAAAARELTVPMANEQHFTPLSVPLVNPLTQLPATDPDGTGRRGGQVFSATPSPLYDRPAKCG